MNAGILTTRYIWYIACVYYTIYAKQPRDNAQLLASTEIENTQLNQ